MKQVTIFALIIVFFIIFPVDLAAQATDTPNFNELEQVALNELKEKNAVGAAVAVIIGDKVVFSKGFGTANIETSTPITSETLFQIGSITKTFTATGILALANDKKLDLNTPVGNYIKNLNPKLGKITLHQLLSQTSGIMDEPDEFGAQDESLMAPYILSWQDNYILFDSGTVFSYSNSGFALAGFTAQEAIKKPYADLMNEKVFQPLGMKSTTFRPTVAMTYPLAVGHKFENGKNMVVRPLPNDARLYPAGTMYSNLNDLSRFAVAFLNKGKIDGRQIFDPDIFEKMSKSYTKQLSADDDTGYGYGLFNNHYRGVHQFWHEGSMTGYAASMLFVPESNFAVIILGNSNNVNFNKTQEKAMEIMLKLKPKVEAKPKNVLPLTEAEMTRYVGIYEQPNRFKADVYIKDAKLFIKEFNNEMPLYKIGENRFSFQFPNAKQPLEIYIKPTTGQEKGFLHQYVWAFKKIQ